MAKISDFVKGIGKGIDEIADKPVTVQSVTFESRTFNDAEKPLVLLTIGDTKSDAVLYHSWSEAVERVFRAVPLNAFPLEGVVFTKVRTRSGRETWIVSDDS